jgi:hypothetical protein
MGVGCSDKVIKVDTGGVPGLTPGGCPAVGWRVVMGGDGGGRGSSGSGGTSDELQSW